MYARQAQFKLWHICLQRRNRTGLRNQSLQYHSYITPVPLVSASDAVGIGIFDRDASCLGELENRGLEIEP